MCRNPGISIFEIFKLKRIYMKMTALVQPETRHLPEQTRLNSTPPSWSIIPLALKHIIHNYYSVRTLKKRSFFPVNQQSPCPCSQLQERPFFQGQIAAKQKLSICLKQTSWVSICLCSCSQSLQYTQLFALFSWYLGLSYYISRYFPIDIFLNSLRWNSNNPLDGPADCSPYFFSLG